MKILTNSQGKPLMNQQGKFYEAPPVEAEENDVNFYDYDGFRVASFTIAEAKALTQAEYDAILPPTHEGLTFQEWNWSWTDITTYNRRYIDIGANYKTTDGKTHIKIHVDNNGDFFKLKIGSSGSTFTVNWGDDDTDTVTSITLITHTYSNAGIYEIVIEHNIGNNDTLWTFNSNDANCFTNEMIDEILFDEKAEIGSYGLKYVYGKVSFSVNTFKNGIAAGVFQNSSIPLVVINRDCPGYKSSICFSQFNGFRVCLPKVFSSTTNVTSTFCDSSLTRLVIPEETTVLNLPLTFILMPNLYIVSIPNSFTPNTSQTGILNFSPNLKIIDIVQGWIPSINLNFNKSSAYSPNAMVDFFNKLGTTTNTITLTFGSTNLNKLTADQKAIATNKGYTLA